MDPAIGEPQAGARNQIPQNARGQNLAGRSELSNPRRDMHGDAADVVRQDLNLARVQSGSNLQTEVAHRVPDGFCTTHGARRSIEGRKKPVARRPDLLAAKSRELATNVRVMP